MSQYNSDLLLDLLNQHGITKSELARRLNCSPSAIFKIIAYPDQKTSPAMAKMLNDYFKLYDPLCQFEGDGKNNNRVGLGSRNTSKFKKGDKILTANGFTGTVVIAKKDSYKVHLDNAERNSVIEYKEKDLMPLKEEEEKKTENREEELNTFLSAFYKDKPEKLEEDLKKNEVIKEEPKVEDKVEELTKSESYELLKYIIDKLMEKM